MKGGWKIATFGAAALAALGYAIAIEPRWIETVHWEIYCPRLPRAFDGYRIYQVSDLHTSEFGSREGAVEAILKSLPPADLVALTGDMIHTRQGINPVLRLIKSMSSTDGIYAVFGNSEHKNGVRPLDFAGKLYKAGVRTLFNQHVIIERGGEEYVLAGVEDPWSDLDDLAMALTGVPDDVFKLALMHGPDSIADAVSHGVDLVLSGHTHGGQVNLPLFGPLITHSRFGSRMSNGYYGRSIRDLIGIRTGRTQLYVTRGLGISGLALRFRCRPEFTILTLRRGGPAGVRRRVPTSKR